MSKQSYDDYSLTRSLRSRCDGSQRKSEVKQGESGPRWETVTVGILSSPPIC